MRSGIVGTGAAPATFFTFGGGGSYFRNGSRPPLTAFLFAAGFSGCVSWATTPIAKPLASSTATLNSKLINRILDLSLTCIIIIFLSTDYADLFLKNLCNLWMDRNHFAGAGAAGAGTAPPAAGFALGAGAGLCKRSEET